MSHISAVIKKYPLTMFFLLTYALSWWAWILYRSEAGSWC
jgi:hypothetical protein